jgi:hypothetical protein
MHAIPAARRCRRAQRVNPYFACTQTPFRMAHSASAANETVVIACEAPPLGLAFTTALNRTNSHMLSSFPFPSQRKFRPCIWTVDVVESSGSDSLGMPASGHEAR